MDALVRAATDADLAAIAAVGDEPMRQGWTVARLTGERDRGLSRVVVAADGDDVVGHAIAWAVAGEAQILDVRVAPRARRAGLGRRLVEAVVSACDAEVALLEVRADNEAAIALYQALGFVRSGARAAYYADGQDAVLMERAG